MPTLMERARTGLADVLLGSEKEKLERTARLLYEAYLEGPWETTPEKLVEQLAAVDSSILTDLLLQLGWESYGLGYTLDSSAERQRAVNESRRLWKYSVVAQWEIGLWTSFGLGESLVITPMSEEPASGETDEDGKPIPLARVVWEEFWTADRNAALLAEDKIHDKLSNWLLVDGERFLAFYASDQDGECTVRRLPADEISEVVKDPNDSATAWWYKRVFSDDAGKQSKTWYYPDWSLFFSDDLEEAAKILPDGAIRADKVNAKEDEIGGREVGTVVCVLHVPFTGRDESGLRGWPLLSPAGAPWIRAHKKFREDRAAVAAHVAMFVSKLKHQGGSRAGAALAAQMQSALSQSNATETNPPAVAGSTWVGNRAIDLERMPLGSGASDAKHDGEAMLLMAGLAGGVFPHYLGAGDAYRLATACYSDDTEVLTEYGWKSWRDWHDGEKIATYNHAERRIDYAIPTKLHIYDYDGDMIHFSGRGIDALVTPNHRMLALNENNVSRKWAKTEYEVIHAEDLPSRFALPTRTIVNSDDTQYIDAFTLPGHTWRTDAEGNGGRSVPDRVIPMKDWLEFLGWWLAEGSLYLNTSSGNKMYSVELCCSAESPDLERIRGLLDRLPFNFYEKIADGTSENAKPTIHWVTSSDKALFTWLEANCGKGSGNKRIPDFVFDLRNDQAVILLNALWDGDGHWEFQEHYRGFLTSTSRQLIDDTQRLMLHTGYWGGIALNRAEDAHPSFEHSAACWILHRNSQDKRSLARRNNCKRVHYEGVVWCFEAPPNKMFITRRNGQPLIAGNTAMERPLLLQWSRYRSFWSAQFRKMVVIVLKYHEKYNGGGEFDTYDAEVSTDQLVQTDADALTQAVARFYEQVLVPQLELGYVEVDTVKRITARVSRVILQAVGVADADEVASDEAFRVGVEEEPPEEEPKQEAPEEQPEQPPPEVAELARTVRQRFEAGESTIEAVADWALTTLEGLRQSDD